MSERFVIDHVSTFLALAEHIGNQEASALATFISDEVGASNFPRFASELFVVGPWAWVAFDEHNYAWLGRPRVLHRKLDGLQMLLHHRPPRPGEEALVYEVTRHFSPSAPLLSPGDLDEETFAAIAAAFKAPETRDGVLVFQTFAPDAEAGTLEELEIELATGGLLHRTVTSRPSG